MINVGRQFRYEDNKILTIQEFMDEYMVHNINPILAQKIINILVKQNKAVWLDTEIRPIIKTINGLADTAKKVNFCGVQISVREYADEFKGGNLIEAENHLNNAVKRGIAEWLSESTLASDVSENADVCINCVESIQKTHINEEDPIIHKKLRFVDQEYTVEEFANKMSDGDIEVAKSLIENLIEKGSVRWIITEDEKCNRDDSEGLEYNPNSIDINADSDNQTICVEKFDYHFKKGIQNKREGNYKEALNNYNIAKNISVYCKVDDIMLYDLHKAYGKLFYIIKEYQQSVDSYIRSINYLIRAGVKKEELLLNDPNIIRHLGYALLAIKSKDVSLNEGVARYIKSIDPFYTNGYFSNLEDGTLEALDKRCTELGCTKVGVPYQQNISGRVNVNSKTSILGLGFKDKGEMEMSQQIGITYMISRTDALTRLKGYELLNEDLMINSKVDNYYGEYQFYRMAGAMVGVLDRAINNSSNPQEIENYKILALRYMALNRKLTEKIAANNDRYFTKHQTLTYIKETFNGPLEALCIISDQDFFDAWHLVNVW